MAKIGTTRRRRAADPEPPSSLTMDLFAPGMTTLHRAGLGGLACTLRYIERAYGMGALLNDDVPGGPWTGGAPPWTIKPSQIILNFGAAESAAEYLKRLFAIAFDLKDGLIYLPGQYEHEPSLAVRAELQVGLTLTFLQHGRVRALAKNSSVFQYDPNGSGQTVVALEYKECTGYKHQMGWRELHDRRRHLKLAPTEVIGPLNPGAVIRHVAHGAQTTIKEPPSHTIPLWFAIVGSLALSINRGSGVLVVPDVRDLIQFGRMRPWFTPSSARECQVAGAGDAALQAQIRLRAKRLVDDNELPGCQAVTFASVSWASQQKSRVRTIQVPPGDETYLDQFEIALAELPPRIVSRTKVETAGRGKAKKKTEKTEWFWVDSIVRPLVADNLAGGRPWYHGFVKLMTQTDSSRKRPLRDKLVFEKKGLHAMIEKIPWEDQGESAVVRAVHEAIRRRYGQIANENKGSPVAMKNRWSGEYDRWRLAFSGAKTPEQFRRSLCDLFGRAGVNPVLQQHWHDLLPMLGAGRWQLTRDLALLALASYVGGGTEQIGEIEPEENSE